LSEPPEATATAPEGARLVARFVAAHVLLFTVVPLLTQPNAPLDVVELQWWGQQWQIGYHKHPPTPAWLIAGSMDLGAGLFGIYLLSQLCIAACFASAWLLARRWLPSAAAVAAALLLESIVYYNDPTPELNPNVVLMATWAWAVTACWSAVETGRLRDWLWLGLAMGLGLLTKYSQGVIGVLLLGWLVLDPVARPCWRRPGPWLACAVALLLFWPHWQWVVAHDWAPLRYAQERSAATAAPRRDGPIRSISRSTNCCPCCRSCSSASSCGGAEDRASASSRRRPCVSWPSWRPGRSCCWSCCPRWPA